MNEVLQQIQKCMSERNWTLYKLSKECDIPYSSLSSLFAKNNQPTISTLEKICDGFNITLSEFFHINLHIGIFHKCILSQTKSLSLKPIN